MIDLFSKESINYGIFIFIIVVIVLLTSFSFFYVLPNNYDIYENKLINNIKPLKTINIKINPGDKYKINNTDIDNLDNMIIQIKTDKKNYPINILLDNFLKSQNLYINEDTLFKSINNSCITIINKNDESYDLNINFYSIEEVLHDK
jgi:hypothetical protein